MTSSTINWILKNIILPLTPFLLGALLRFFKAKTLGINLFDASELSFSMGILCLIVSQSATRLPDVNLGEALANTLTFFMIIFLAMYACSSFIKVHQEFIVGHKLHTIEILSKSKNFSAINNEINNKNHSEFDDIVVSISWFVGVMTIICVPTVLSFKIRYNLN